MATLRRKLTPRSIRASSAAGASTRTSSCSARMPLTEVESRRSRGRGTDRSASASWFFQSLRRSLHMTARCRARHEQRRACRCEGGPRNRVDFETKRLGMLSADAVAPAVEGVLGDPARRSSRDWWRRSSGVLSGAEHGAAPPPRRPPTGSPAGWPTWSSTSRPRRPPRGPCCATWPATGTRHRRTAW